MIGSGGVTSTDAIIRDRSRRPPVTIRPASVGSGFAVWNSSLRAAPAFKLGARANASASAPATSGVENDVPVSV